MINRCRSVVPVAIAMLALVLASPTLALDLGRRPLLGITAANLSQADQDANHLAADQGVSVQRITPGSGADRAGLAIFWCRSMPSRLAQSTRFCGQCGCVTSVRPSK
jgi:S1-C subfamily serine protease